MARILVSGATQNRIAERNMCHSTAHSLFQGEQFQKRRRIDNVPIAAFNIAKTLSSIRPLQGIRRGVQENKQLDYGIVAFSLAFPPAVRVAFSRGFDSRIPHQDQQDKAAA